MKRITTLLSVGAMIPLIVCASEEAQDKRRGPWNLERYQGRYAFHARNCVRSFSEFEADIDRDSFDRELELDLEIGIVDSSKKASCYRLFQLVSLKEHVADPIVDSVSSRCVQASLHEESSSEESIHLQYIEPIEYVDEINRPHPFLSCLRDLFTYYVMGTKRTRIVPIS